MATFVMASVLRARVLRSAAVAPQASKAAVAATPAPAGTPHEGALTIEQINDPVRFFFLSLARLFFFFLINER